MLTHISVRGAREHNLKGIDVDIPRESLTVITGLSGSGKSSLAFDTIYAEGQRRYVESLSAYARQFLEMMQKPDVEHIDGLSPAISIEQKTTSRNPRSTVATVTEIYDYMRLLWARVGVPYSPATGLPIEAQQVSQMVDRTLALPEGSRHYLLAPVVRGRKGEYRKELAEWQKAGFTRVRIDGEFHDIEEAPALDKKYKHDIEVVVDRIVVREGIEARLADSFETALKLADGLAYLDPADLPSLSGEGPGVGQSSRSARHEAPTPYPSPEGEGKSRMKLDYAPPGRIVFSQKFACPVSGFTIAEIEPRLFSFNAPQGACPACDGLGEKLVFDEDLVVPNHNLSIAKGAVVPWAKSNPPSPYYMQVLSSLARAYDFELNVPWRDLPEQAQQVILHGTAGKPVTLRFVDGRKSYEVKKPFEGVIGNLNRRMLQTESAWMREELSRYQSSLPCETCGGARLKPEVLAVTVDGRSISELCQLSVEDALDALDRLALSATQAMIGERVIMEVRERLRFLDDVGLGYLTLARAAGTLSGGEAQRIRLATQIGSGLVGVLYILDEPSIGLHQRDNRRLIATLERLRDQGNTVLVVEHDEDMIRSADHVIDMGPGAGSHGGRVVAEGDVPALEASPASLTGAFLSGRRAVPVPAVRREPRGWLTVRGARENNLAGVDVAFPVGALTCVTGVSGSGKSTLVNEVLLKALTARLGRKPTRPGAHDGIDGLDHFDKVIDIDQSPIGRTPRSNPATYTGVFDHIRHLFSQTKEARARGYGPGRFSFNVKGGRCEACKGDGTITIEMHFLPDVYVPCEVCGGARYNRETLEVRYGGRTISEVLELSVEEAVEAFSAVPRIHRRLQTLHDVGLDYVRLGQPATTLSGGEAQRVKLATELSKVATGRTLYVLDEPTTGLHFADIEKLLEVVQRLVDQGNTVVVIEHNLDVIKCADWIVDLGPEGGAGGGRLIAAGTPEEVASAPGSHTGEFLAPLVNRQPAGVAP